MENNKYILLALLFLFPCIISSEEAVLPTETGIGVILETSYPGEKQVAHSRTSIMKQGNRVRVEEAIEVKGEERLTGVSIYDGQSTWTISSKGKKKDKGFRGYPWTYPLDKGIKVKSGKLEGRDVRIVDIEGKRLYLDPEKDVILFEERGKYRTYYKDYSLVEGMGYIPRVIEETDSRGKLVKKTEMKKIERFMTFSDDVFDPDKVEVYTAPGRREVPD